MHGMLAAICSFLGKLPLAYSKIPVSEFLHEKYTTDGEFFPYWLMVTLPRSESCRKTYRERNLRPSQLLCADLKKGQDGHLDNQQ